MTIKRVTLFVLIVLQLTQLDASIISDLNGPQDDDGDLYNYFLRSDEKLQNRSYSEIPATLHCTAGFDKSADAFASRRVALRRVVSGHGPNLF
jgi:hypothetical protein